MNKFFFVKNEHLLDRVDIDAILYVAVEANYCHLKLLDQKTLVLKISLKQLLSYLDMNQFLRIHKSYVININYLKQVDIKSKTVSLQNEELPIGRTYYSKLSNHISLFALKDQ